jgi:hypothetical protein
VSRHYPVFHLTLQKHSEDAVNVRFNSDDPFKLSENSPFQLPVSRVRSLVLLFDPMSLCVIFDIMSDQTMEKLREVMRTFKGKLKIFYGKSYF